MILYRAATSVDPYFGRGSYWSPSLAFAQWFCGWLDENFVEAAPHNVYRADVDTADRLDIPFGTWVESQRISALVEDLAAKGYRWVTFFEGAVNGDVVAQFVYLGDESISALTERPADSRTAQALPEGS